MIRALYIFFITFATAFFVENDVVGSAFKCIGMEEIRQTNCLKNVTFTQENIHLSTCWNEYVRADFSEFHKKNRQSLRNSITFVKFFPSLSKCILLDKADVACTEYDRPITENLIVGLHKFRI